MYQENFDKTETSKSRNKVNISLLQEFNRGTRVRISINKDKLAGITKVVQERDKVKRVECREEFEESLCRDWIELDCFGEEREKSLDIQVYAIEEYKGL